MTYVNRRLLLGAATLAAGRGGIARVARLTARALIDLGVDLAMLSFLDNASERVGERTTQTARCGRLAFAARCHAASFSRTHFIYDSAGTARAHARLWRFQRPYAVWMHGIEVWEGLPAHRHRAIRGAGLVLVNSEFTLDRFRELHGPIAHARVCWPATEDDELPRSVPRFPGPPTVLILARIEESENYKGHEELVACWPDVVSAVPEARLLIAGGGSAVERVRRLANASSAAPSIEVTGFVPEAEIDQIWQRAHVFAMPSRGEGFGLVYAEAMRHALPVIASVHDAGREVNGHGVTGFNVNLGKKGDLASRLIALFRNPALAQRMGQAGQRRWREQFCYSAFRRRFAPILREFAGTSA
jgi:phosphatidyl-myo-inositol dimannoside synthase